MVREGSLYLGGRGSGILGFELWPYHFLSLCLPASPSSSLGLHCLIHKMGTRSLASQLGGIQQIFFLLLFLKKQKTTLIHPETSLMLNISLIFPAPWKTRGNFTGPMPRLSTYYGAGHCPSRLNDLSISLMASISQRRKLRLPEDEGPFPRPQGYATSSAPHPSLGRFS